MEIRNKNFNIGEKYKGDTNGMIFEVIDKAENEFGEEYIRFQLEGTDKTYKSSLELAKRLLLTKI